MDLIEEQREEDLESIDEKTEEDLANLEARAERENLTDVQLAARKKAIIDKNAADKLKVEIESDRKSAEIKTKQAKAEKAAAISNIIISTAVGVAKAWSNPFTAPALIPLIIASGAIQAATVLATPIPKFFTGVGSSPDTFIAGDSRMGDLER